MPRPPYGCCPTRLRSSPAPALQQTAALPRSDHFTEQPPCTASRYSRRSRAGRTFRNSSSTITGAIRTAHSARRSRACAAMCNRTGSSLRRSEEHTSELQSLMRISYAVFCLKKKKQTKKADKIQQPQTTTPNHTLNTLLETDKTPK